MLATVLALRNKAGLITRLWPLVKEVKRCYKPRIDFVAGAGDAVASYPPQGVAGVADGVRTNATVTVGSRRH
jgi:hypothetical protein